MEHEWYRLPGQSTAHAFAAGPGWMRSACGEVRWTTRLVRVERSARCPACVVALTTDTVAGPAMTEAEAALAFGR